MPRSTKPPDYPGTQKQWDLEQDMSFSGDIWFHTTPAPDRRRLDAGVVFLEGGFSAAQLRQVIDALENP